MAAWKRYVDAVFLDRTHGTDEQVQAEEEYNEALKAWYFQNRVQQDDTQSSGGQAEDGSFEVQGNPPERDDTQR